MRERQPESRGAFRPWREKFHLDELSGHVELGMKREALRLARQVFRRQKPNSAEFNGALVAVLIHGNGLKSWKPLVEQAYARLPKRDKRTARSQMLGFYHSLKDWKSAYHFLPARSKNACDLMFAMETLLNLRELDAAKRLQRSCLRMLDQPLDSLDHGALLLALGSYHAQIGELGAAMEYFGKLTENEILAHSAWTAIVQIEAVRGLLYVGAGLLQFDKFRQTGTDEQAIILPHNRDAMFAAAERDLKRYEKALHKIVPPDELWRFGWSAD